MAHLDGKVALITGAGSGIGRAAALRLAHDGACVMAADINADTAEATARLIREAGGEGAGATGDVANRAAVVRLVIDTIDRFGGLDIMVSNAGIGLAAPFLEMTEADLDRIIAVNLKGVFWCGQAAARSMVERHVPGHIVNTASTYAEVCAPNDSAYCATKAGVRMLTKAMALELGPHGIQVNAVAPGWIRTGMNPLQDPERNQMLEAAIPLGRIGTPEDVAGVIAFLCSPDSRYVSGETVLVDGGWIVQ